MNLLTRAAIRLRLPNDCARNDPLWYRRLSLRYGRMHAVSNNYKLSTPVVILTCTNSNKKPDKSSTNSRERTEAPRLVS